MRDLIVLLLLYSTRFFTQVKLEPVCAYMQLQSYFLVEIWLYIW